MFIDDNEKKPEKEITNEWDALLLFDENLRDYIAELVGRLEETEGFASSESVQNGNGVSSTYRAWRKISESSTLGLYYGTKALVNLRGRPISDVLKLAPKLERIQLHRPELSDDIQDAVRVYFSSRKGEVKEGPRELGDLVSAVDGIVSGRVAGFGIHGNIRHYKLLDKRFNGYFL